jgi:predicted PurR-regulated permease PerM
MEKPSKDWNEFKRFFTFLAAFFLVVVSISYLYKSIFLALMLSLALAFILQPTVRWLSNNAKLKSKITVISTLLCLVFGTLTLIAIVFMPRIYREIIAIVTKAPMALTYLESHFIPVRDWLVSEGYLTKDHFEQIWASFDFAANISSTSSNAFRQVISSTPQVIGSAINLILVPVFTWFIMVYYDVINRFIFELIPRDVKALARATMMQTNRILWGVIKGQLVVAASLAVLYMLGFSLIGLQSGIAIGALAGICRVVPYLDVIVGLALSVIVIISQGESFTMLAAVAIVIGIVQAIDGMLITPRIIGERAGIHPVVVIASVIAFGDWFGLLGIIIAVPVVAIGVANLQKALPYYQSSPYFKNHSND